LPHAAGGADAPAAKRVRPRAPEARGPAEVLRRHGEVAGPRRETLRSAPEPDGSNVGRLSWLSPRLRLARSAARGVPGDPLHRARPALLVRILAREPGTRAARKSPLPAPRTVPEPLRRPERGKRVPRHHARRGLHARDVPAI